MVESALFALVLLAAIAVPVGLVNWWFKQFLHRRDVEIDELTSRGGVHTADPPVRFGIVMVGFGAVLAGLGLLPMLIWIVDGDGDAARAALVVAVLATLFGVLGLASIWSGMRIWIVEPDRLTLRRRGNERHIAFADITEVAERRSVAGGANIRSADNHIAVPKQLQGFDTLVAQVQPGAASNPAVSPSDQTSEGQAPNDRSPDTASSYSIPTWQTYGTIMFLIVLLVFFLAWPWFLVTGVHPTRDSIIFMGIGLGIWAGIYYLVEAEAFQKDQPAALRLRHADFDYRLQRQSWVTTQSHELVSVAVETRIRYVRGIPGYLHPLVMVFTNGTRLEVDDQRAKHLGVNTRMLSDEFRRRFFDPASRDLGFQQQADSAQQRGAQAEQSGAIDVAIAAYQEAIAAYPDAQRQALFGHIGDLQRGAANHVHAVSSYWAHIDHAPHDAQAWEGLAASQQVLGHNELAAEATQTAERLLLNP